MRAGSHRDTFHSAQDTIVKSPVFLAPILNTHRQDTTAHTQQHTSAAHTTAYKCSTHNHALHYTQCYVYTYPPRVQRQADDDDKGYVSISYGLFATGLHVEDRNVRYCRVALLCSFAFLNILMPILLAKSLSWYYPRVRAVASGRHFTACLYWAAALIAFLCNVVYTAASLYSHFVYTAASLYSHFVYTAASLYSHFVYTAASLYSHFVYTAASLYSHFVYTAASLYSHFVYTAASLYSHFVYTAASLYSHFHNHPAITSCIIELSKCKCSIPSDTSLYKDEVLTLVAKVTIIPIAVCAELVVSILTVRHHIVGRRHHLWKHCLLETVHVIALWNILIVLQIITMSAIPLCVLLLTHPQVTFLCLALLIMVLVGLTAIVAYLMYLCQSPRRNIRHCGSIFVHFTVIISTMGLIFSLLWLYEQMLVAQVQVETGIMGIVLSLLPSLPLSALGWYVKRKYQTQRAVINECSETSQSSEEQSTNVTIQSSDTEDEKLLPL